MQHGRLHQAVVPVILAAIFAGLPASQFMPPKSAAQRVSEAVPVAEEYVPAQLLRSANTDSAISGVLSDKDIDIYKRILEAQRASDWQQADHFAQQLTNRILLGYVLAERFTAKRYVSAGEELRDWLEQYADHPQAPAIYALAVRKTGKSGLTPPDSTRQSSLQGYGDSNGLSGRLSYRPNMIEDSVWAGRPEARSLWQAVENAINAHDIPRAQAIFEQRRTQDVLKQNEKSVLQWELAEQHFYRGNNTAAYTLAGNAAVQSGETMPGIHWMAGLTAWKAGKIAASAKHFAAMAEREHNSPWEKSAAAYWAYRAYKKLGEEQKANDYLRQAAHTPRTFYSILARRTLGQPIFLPSQQEVLKQPDTDALYAIPPVRRAVALAQIGENEMAEKELRGYFPQSPRESRKELLSLVQYLSLPALQISMASQMVKQGEDVEAALYPLPDWEPETGFGLDPALVFALARQESGFRASARASSGAMGVMQLMPETAKLMRKSLGNPVTMPLEGMLEPEMNITLGQHYLEHLMRTPSVGNNLFYVIAAYNAGPGNLSQWRARGNADNDPLLFLETIPFTQTRHYVKQVMANYWIYQELRGEKPATAQALAEGSWPVYRSSSELAQR